MLLTAKPTLLELYLCSIYSISFPTDTWLPMHTLFLIAYSIFWIYCETVSAISYPNSFPSIDFRVERENSSCAYSTSSFVT